MSKWKPVEILPNGWRVKKHLSYEGKLPCYYVALPNSKAEPLYGFETRAQARAFALEQE